MTRKKRKDYIGYMDNEYTEGIWEHDIAFTTAPGTVWTWRRCFAVGGKTNFWGRSSARFSEIDFQAASGDGYDVDWPVTYAEIAPYYSRVERMIGVASTVQNRPSNPDGDYLPPMNFRCIDRHSRKRCGQGGIPYLPDRIAQLTRSHNGHPACHYCGNCTEGCDTGSFFSTPWFFLPEAEKSGNLEIRTNALAKNILTDENGHAAGVAYIDRQHDTGSRSLWARGGCRRVLRRVGAHSVEFEIASLAERDRELQRTGRPQSLRPPVWHNCARLFSSTARASPVSPTTFRPAPSHGCRAGRIWTTRNRKNSSAATRFIPMAAVPDSRRTLDDIEGFGSEVQTRDQAPLSDSGELLHPSAHPAQRFKLRVTSIRK